MIIIRYLLVVSLSLSYVHSSRRSTSRTPRIVGGRRALVEEIPYMVNIRSNGSFHCGGSLITSKCVVTAAHCVKYSKPKELAVRAGVTYLRERHNLRMVSRIIKHPRYNIKTVNFDVAILVLKAPIRGRNIRTIPLTSKPPPNGSIVRVSGWGLERENGYISEQLKSAQLGVISRWRCANFYKGLRNITDAMFCAYVPGQRDACQGDSGGPAVFDNHLVGIVSWGRRSQCARRQSPGVYVNVAHVRPWFDAVIPKHCY